MVPLLSRHNGKLLRSTPSNNAIAPTQPDHLKRIPEPPTPAVVLGGARGSGKSSLALALASYSLGRGPAFKEAKQLLCDVPEVTAVFGRAPKDWLCVPLSGRRGDPVADLREALASAIAGEPGHARTKRSKMEAADGRDIVERLQREVEARPKGGVLVIVDELGKYLEGAADHAIDIHFFQDLAEAANRSEGRLIVVGVLHQAFERYADRLGQSVQDEWRKVQGRFADVPIITAGGLMTIVAIKKTAEGQARQAIMAALGTEFYCKCVVVVDNDVDIFNLSDGMWAVITRTRADKDFVFIPGAMGAILDPTSDPEDHTLTKLGVDATKPSGRDFAERLTIANDQRDRVRGMMERAGFKL